MVHEHRGENDLARNWFDKAVARTRQNAAQDPDVLKLWNAAAKLLGQPGPPAAGQASDPPPTEKPR